ncbi:hypothetical protein L2E82_05322 [Cichorium intybus]|uniref:Uncharacterized protein n=1 Tax=Cichorium intybus TaxID=13427 RepID=A0ACB9H722_CICIN|nr:hypothetical protein L2E82_05322 [Cichorium intybus]
MTTTHPKCQSRFRAKPLRATLVEEARPRTLPQNRADDNQAESNTLARTINATLYSPELLKFKYTSRPFKVQLDQNKRSRAIELRETFTKLGPTFVKIGQGLSTRPDLCPLEFLEELSKF